MDYLGQQNTRLPKTKRVCHTLQAPLNYNKLNCVMYRAGSITEQLDSQTVPVIQDAEGYDSVIQTFTDTFASVELKLITIQKLLH